MLIFNDPSGLEYLALLLLYVGVPVFFFIFAIKDRRRLAGRGIVTDPLSAGIFYGAFSFATNFIFVEFVFTFIKELTSTDGIHYTWYPNPWLAFLSLSAVAVFITLGLYFLSRSRLVTSPVLNSDAELKEQGGYGGALIGLFLACLGLATPLAGSWLLLGLTENISSVVLVSIIWFLFLAKKIFSILRMKKINQPVQVKF
jgi:hypothetical protein